MRHDSPFLVHVGELIRRPGSTRRHRLTVPVEWAVEMSRIDVGVPVDADLELAGTSGGIVVKGAIDATVVHTCARCLEEREVAMTVELAQLVEHGTDPGGDGSDYRTEGEEIDLEPVLRDEVLLAMPLLPHCEECRELVRPPDSDLNTGAPAESGRTESPFAVLQDLFEPRD